eukprot:364743-Chlamydomonas_euryale.AAC.37
MSRCSNLSCRMHGPHLCAVPRRWDALALLISSSARGVWPIQQSGDAPQAVDVGCKSTKHEAPGTAHSCHCSSLRRWKPAFVVNSNTLWPGGKEGGTRGAATCDMICVAPIGRHRRRAPAGGSAVGRSRRRSLLHPW